RTDLAQFTGRPARQVRSWALPTAVIGAGGRDVLGAVALASIDADRHVDTFPFRITRDVIAHGQNRYLIYCVVCHDPLGTGHGKIVDRGSPRPPSYHIPRLRQAPVGHFFDVITNGYGSMPDYKQQIPVRDRWAIVAYVRALQLSQHFPEGKLTGAMKSERDKQEGQR